MERGGTELRIAEAKPRRNSVNVFSVIKSDISKETAGQKREAASQRSQKGRKDAVIIVTNLDILLENAEPQNQHNSLKLRNSKNYVIKMYINKTDSQIHIHSYNRTKKKRQK